MLSISQKGSLKDCNLNSFFQLLLFIYTFLERFFFHVHFGCRRLRCCFVVVVVVEVFCNFYSVSFIDFFDEEKNVEEEEEEEDIFIKFRFVEVFFLIC